MMNQNDSGQLSRNQHQHFGDVQMQGDGNTFNAFQGRDITVTQTKIIQIAVDEIKTRELIVTSPYKGLKKFEPRDADRFFGREQFLNGLIKELEQTNFVLLLGASGSGKSSVVRAGLIPMLEQKWGNHFVSLMFTPDRDPFESLYNSLRSGGYTQSQAESAKAGEVKTFSQVVKALKPPEAFWLILIDQLEELFTVSEPEKRDRFIRSLNQLSEAKISGLKIVATMRSDFLNYLDPSPANLLARLTDKHRPLITQMQPDELRLAIEQPAAHHGVVFEEGLVEEIIKDVQGQAGYLPLLQYTLDLLWESEVKDAGIQDRTLNISSYRRLGGVRGALQQHVDQIYQSLPKPEQLAAQRIFLRLVEINSNEARGTEWKPVRRRASRAEFQGEMEQTVLTTLINQKLLVSDAPVEDRHQPTLQGATVEIAHEILLTSWTTLNSWIQENRQSIALRNRLEQDVKLWQGEKADSDLWSGAKLTQVLELRNDSTFQQVLGGFSEIANQFIDGSVELKNRQQQQQERQRRRIVFGLSGFSAIALVLLGFVLYQLQQAQRQRVEQLAATSQALLATEPVEATVNALAAIGLSRSAFVQFPDQPQFASVESSLLSAIQTYKERNRLLHTDEVSAVAISADGKTIVSGGSDGTVRLWNAQTGEPISRPPAAHSYRVTSVAISADGKTIVSSSADGTVRLWNAQTATGQLLPSHSQGANSVAISADGKTIVSGGFDGTVRLWNAQMATGQSLPGSSEVITSVAISADGTTIVSGGNSGSGGTVRLWNAQTGKPIGQPLTGPSKGVLSVATSADGKTVISADRNGTVRYLNAQTGALIGQPLPVSSEGFKSVDISADGTTIVSGGSDGTVRLWNAQTGKPIDQRLTGHSELVNSVAISADGKTIVSGGDRTVRLWSTQTGERIGQPLTVSTERVTSFTISADGTTIVSGGDDGSVRLWDARTGKPIGQPLPTHSDGVNSVTISADGKTIVSSSYETFGRFFAPDSKLILWNAQTGKPIGQPLTDPSKQVLSVATSADGKTVISANHDGTVRYLNAQTGALIGQLLLVSSEGFNSVAISADGKIIVSGGSDGTVRLWNAQTGKPIGQPLVGPPEGVDLDGLGADARQMKSVDSVAISANGTTIVSKNGDGTVRFWNTQTGEPIPQTLTGSSKSITSVTISANGRIIVSGDSNGTVRLWNAQTGEPIGQPLTGHSDGVNFVAISADGKTMVSGDVGGTVRRWDVSPEQLLKIACEQLQYHSIRTNPTTDVAKEARSTCQNFGG